MAVPHIFAGTAGGTTAQLDANNAYLEDRCDNLNSDGSGNVSVGATAGTSSWSVGGAPRLSLEKAATYSAAAFYAYAANSTGAGLLVLGHSRGTSVASLVQTQSGDRLGIVSAEGVNTASALVGAAYVILSQDGAAGASYIPGRIEFHTSSGSAAPALAGYIDSAKNLVRQVPATPPTLATNGDMVVNLTSNTNLRISVRGSDGTTRVANITLA